MKKPTTKIMTAKRLAVAVATVCATLSAPVFAGEDIKGLMDLLLKKGVITQQEYDQNIQAAQDAAENQAFKEKRLSDDVTKLNKVAEKSKDTGSVMKNGLGIQSADGQISAQLTGRVHMDYRSFDKDAGIEQATSGFSARRTRLGLRGNLTKDFDYLILGDFTDGSTTATSQTRIDEGYLTYSGYKPVQVRAGKFKAPFSLEQLTSSNNIDFMERSLTGSDDKELIPGKQFGAMIFGNPMSGVSYALARHAGASGTESASRDASDTTGRLAANFAEVAGNKEWVTHVGIAYSVGKVGNTAASVAPSTEGKGLSSFLVTNSTAVAVNSSRTRLGYELAVANGPFKVQGEMYSFDYGDNQTVQQNITGSYVQAIWNITGESHNYSNSSNTFGFIKPKQDFSTEKGGLGAWQVGLRYSKIDTDIAATTSLTNAADATTLGLTWFANGYTRVMLNYVQTNFASNVKVATTGQTQEKAWILRTQVSF